MLDRKWRALFLGAFVVAGAGVSEAQVARTFAAVSGNDGNDCLTPTTACRTINGAVAKVDTDGEVIIVSTGSYAGANITKGVRINAPSGIVAFAAQPIIVNAPGGNVLLRGLTIKSISLGVGTGINVTAVGKLSLDSIVVDGWSTGVDIDVANARVSVANSTFRNNAQNGLQVAQAKVDIVQSKFENNTFFGLSALNGAIVSVSRSSATGNAYGFTAQEAGTIMAVNRCLASRNSLSGLGAGSTAILRFGDSSVTGNNFGVINDSAVIQSFSTSAVRGNSTNTSGVITPIALQ